MADLEVLDAEPQGNLPKPSQADESNDELAKKPPADGLGILLDEKDEKKVAKRVFKTLWSSQDKLQKNRLAMWEVNEERRAGNPHVRLKKQIDEDIYTVYYPRGTENAPPSLNKTDDLCTKVVSQILVDPPRAECVPSSDEDKDRDSAEFSEKVLEDLMSESGIQAGAKVRQAVDLACTYWSSFIVPYVDPFGGGWRPREIMASNAATTEADALFGEQGPQPEPYVIRYIAPDGSLVDEPSEADVDWLPKIRAKVMTGKNVRLFPATCESVQDAECAIIAEFLSIGELRALYKKVREMTPEDQRKLCGFRPDGWEDLLPKGQQPENDSAEPQDKTKEPADDTLALIFTTIYRSSPLYKKGAFVVTGADCFVLDRFVWTMEVEREGKAHEIPMDVPVAQFRQFSDTSPTRDPLGRGLVDKVGDGDPLLAMAIGAMVEYIPKALNPHLLVPLGSGIDSKSMQLPRGTPIPFMGNAGTPVWEKLPPFPPQVMEMYDRIDARMNSKSGLEEAAQGMSSPEVRSGTHAMRIIEQAKVAITSPKEGMENGFVRLCRIMLQLTKKYYTQPQKLRLTGAGGKRKVKEWTKAELGDTSDVKIRAGTSTMLTESAKKSLAAEEFEMMVKVDPAGAMDRYRRSVEGSIDPLLALTSDPPREEVLDQIAEWKEGPPEGWAPVEAPIDPLTNQPAIDPATGAPLPPPVDPANPFDRRPHHMEQDIAITRHKELKRAMAQADFQKHPPEWQQLFVAEYEEMRKAGGIATVAEQQMAQQQQMQQQQEMAMQQKGPQADPEAEAMAKQQEAQMQEQAKAEERAFQQQEKQADREFQMIQAEQVNALKSREIDLKEREMNAPVEVATAQADAIMAGVIPTVQEAVAVALQSAVEQVTAIQGQVGELVQQATEPLAQEMLSQRHTLRLLAQAVQTPPPVAVLPEQQPMNVVVQLPEPKKKTVRLHKSESGETVGVVTEEGGGTKVIRLHRSADGELVGEVSQESEPMKKVSRRKGNR